MLDIGWVLADREGAELATHTQLWRLPRGERIHSRAFAAHRITAAMLGATGVDARPELGELFALVSAALARGVAVIAHHASFDVGRLNHTARRHGLSIAPLHSAEMLCTMHSATRHCGLRKRGGKALKPPRNEELHAHMFGRPPTGTLHRAPPDCRVTLACFVEGRKRKRW